MTEPTPTPSPRDASPDVTAIVVTRGPTPFLPQTLGALAAQDVRPARVVVVDVSPSDASGADDLPALARLRSDGVQVDLVAVPRASSFGVAVEHARATLGIASDWLWLLHDDSAPEPGALRALARAVEHKPSVALAGAKQRDWWEPARLLEVGVRTTPAGRRMTGIELGEVDQGQHDAREDVLAVGLAGALVRTAAWMTLAGTDPAVGRFGDSLELSRRARRAGYRVIVVPGAAVRHAQAGLRGLRDDPVDVEATGAPRVDPAESTYGARRASTLHLRLAGTHPLLVPLHTVAMLVLAPLRAGWHLLLKRPSRARGELAAAIRVLLRPRAMWRARRLARRTAQQPRSSLRPLEAGWRDVWSEQRDLRLARAELRRHAVAADPLERAERATARRRRWAATGLVTVALVALSVWWFGAVLGALAEGGRLVSAALAPSGAGASDLARLVLDGAGPTADGHATYGHPLLLVLVPLAALAGGSLQGAVHVLLVASPVLAGLGAWNATAMMTRSLALRAVSALAWAAAPVLAVAVATGHLGGVLVHVALPWAVWGLVRSVRAPAHAVRAGGSLAAAGLAGLMLAVVVAGAPVLLPVVVVLVALVAVLVRGARWRLLATLVPTAVVLVPAVLQVADAGWGGWQTLLRDPTRPTVAPVPGWQLALGWPGPAPEPSDVVVHAGMLGLGTLVVLVAVAGLLRGGALGRLARAAWLLVAVGLASAVAATLVAGAAPGGAVSVVLLASGAAAVAALDGSATRAAAHPFGWRQTGLATLGGLGVAAIVLSVVSVGPRNSLAAGSGDRLHVLAHDVLPAVGRQLQGPPREARVLVLEPGEVLGYQRWRGAGPELVDRLALVDSTVPDAAAPGGAPEAAIGPVAAGLAAGVDQDPALLGRLGIGAVVVTGPDDAARRTLVARLDTTGVLERVTDGDFGVLWRVAGAPSWATLVAGDVRTAVPAVDHAVDVPLESLAVGAGGTLELAEAPDPRWRATLDGVRLAATDAAGAQAFVVPAGSGDLRVWFAPAPPWWRVLVVATTAAYALLVIPVRRRGGGWR